MAKTTDRHTEFRINPRLTMYYFLLLSSSSINFDNWNNHYCITITTYTYFHADTGKRAAVRHSRWKESARKTVMCRGKTTRWQASSHEPCITSSRAFKDRYRNDVMDDLSLWVNIYSVLYDIVAALDNVSVFKKRVKMCWVFFLGPNPKGWGPIDSGCPSVRLSVRHRFFSRLYLCNGWS